MFAVPGSTKVGAVDVQVITYGKVPPTIVEVIAPSQDSKHVRSCVTKLPVEGIASITHA